MTTFPSEDQGAAHRLSRRTLGLRACRSWALWSLIGGGAWSSALAAAPTERPMARVDVGHLERWEAPPLRHITPRPVDVWIPPGLKPGQPHRVLCMHDGQMLFDARTTWNRQAWNAHHAVLAGLGSRPDALPTIILGIWNLQGQRYAEYFPEKALALASRAAREGYVRREAHGQAKADAYLRCIVDELLPHLESRWGPRADGHGVLVAGASMGGLISLYALCEYPHIFSGAAGLSTHWVSVAPSRSDDDKRNQDLSRAFLDYLGQKLPPAGRHRIWADRGDDALDALYAPGLTEFGQLLAARGYTARDGVARVFGGTGHNETDWSRRFSEAVRFIAGA